MSDERIIKFWLPLYCGFWLIVLALFIQYGERYKAEYWYEVGRVEITP